MGYSEETETLASIAKRLSVTLTYIKECQEQLKRTMEASDVLINKKTDEEKCCCESFEQATFKVRVFAVSGNVIEEIEGVSAIKRQPETDTTEFYLLDKNANMIASFVANNVAGYQIIEE